MRPKGYFSNSKKHFSHESFGLYIQIGIDLYVYAMDTKTNTELRGENKTKNKKKAGSVAGWKRTPSRDPKERKKDIGIKKKDQGQIESKRNKKKDKKRDNKNCLLHVYLYKKNISRGFRWCRNQYRKS